MTVGQGVDIIKARDITGAVKSLWTTIEILQTTGALTDGELLALYRGAGTATLASMEKAAKYIDSVRDAEGR